MKSVKDEARCGRSPVGQSRCGTLRRERLRLAATALGLPLTLLVVASLSSLGGYGGGGEHGAAPASLLGVWRVAEVGTAASGTAPCPRRVDIEDSATVSCGADDSFEFREDGGFRCTYGKPDGGPDATLIGTWTTSSGSGAPGTRVTVRITEDRRDGNGNRTLDPGEVLPFDPPLVLTGEVAERSGARAVVDVTPASPLPSGELTCRAVLTGM